MTYRDHLIERGQMENINLKMYSNLLWSVSLICHVHSFVLFFNYAWTHLMLIVHIFAASFVWMACDRYAFCNKGKFKKLPNRLWGLRSYRIIMNSILDSFWISWIAPKGEGTTFWDMVMAVFVSVTNIVRGPIWQMFTLSSATFSYTNLLVTLRFASFDAF